MRIETVNENCCIVYLADTINEDVSNRVHAASQVLTLYLGDILTDLIPSYTSILICFDLNKTDHFDIVNRIQHALSHINQEMTATSKGSCIEIPVYYGPEVAFDLREVCRLTQLTEQGVIDSHTSKAYRVYAIGFSPGFSYLGSLSSDIAVPRKANPRLRVPPGSVALADNQTAIYPSATPGGWQIIGRTPYQMLDWQSNTLTRVKVGDRVRFMAIDREDYIRLGGTFDEL